MSDQAHIIHFLIQPRMFGTVQIATVHIYMVFISLNLYLYLYQHLSVWVGWGCACFFLTTQQWRGVECRTYNLPGDCLLLAVLVSPELWNAHVPRRAPRKQSHR